MLRLSFGNATLVNVSVANNSIAQSSSASAAALVALVGVRNSQAELRSVDIRNNTIASPDDLAALVR